MRRASPEPGKPTWELNKKFIYYKNVKEKGLTGVLKAIILDARLGAEKQPDVSNKSAKIIVALNLL